MIEADRELLLDLLRLPTAGPLETDGPDRLPDAQLRYAAAAERIGCTVLHHAPPTPAEVCLPDTPTIVLDAVENDPTFLARQPSLVLRLGPERPVSDTVLCNVHLDTVAGTPLVEFDGQRFTGRGAIDAKGPAVALLAGIRAAAEVEPAIGRTVAVLVQAVAGEEGGALGTVGTRPLVRRGGYGRLNICCEPTGLRYLPRATAAMTARIRVAGADAVDDRPGAGHNASVLLGHLAQFLAHRLDQFAPCVAGLHTGRLHNRVYGSGELLVNLAYADPAAAATLERAVTAAVADGIAEFTHRFAGSATFGRTARDAAAITTLAWAKRGLPALVSADPWGEELLRRSGVPRWPDDEPAFTCDAIWLHGIPDTYTVVFGPGTLDGNNAHADGEFARVSELDSFAAAISRILLCFARNRTGS